ncbi:MarR family winged helix-turn-helix transcriptional regulator [Clostridium sp. UBA2485]|uniref:MarR family winged helix-turn-helix transcriptional regulator n=1 Tax=Clostridium sp. UBA2485 TaxID=1946352 RepID=UPI0025C2B1C0|nr:MarR family transcriptional regulator [Clostridium sp. UBA2485]
MGQILREIGMIARCFETISNVEFKEFELAKGQYLYLVRICENPGIISNKVSEMLKVDRTTTARAINKLEKSGFIEMRKDNVNKRILRIYPTEKGRTTYKFLKEEEAYSDFISLQGLSEEEKDILSKLLVRVRENIQSDWEAIKKGGTREYLNK